ncbi:shikimate dehydrogenase [Calidifontibacillus erzurumensis]|uniref:Shikimate dehydrogenase (NADP(+)) n=1 Tax=Calidifontibacillus erzurumensis TaxID=2741433 RepID=A0A8J8GDK5_9BACI|nr:shikimate dehydrogenase [Calidifontibacillus erzurumensis]NSL50255.1 shikimate dehydrogenase [Calidifontibacillus erzurumensis]
MGKLFGLLGHPVGHSLSPIMHNDQFAHLGLDCHYTAFDVLPEQLENAVKGIRALGIAGFNVTIPHKVQVMEYLDEIDEEARQIGAVNTVVNNNGTLIGYNTDGKGFAVSLEKLAGENFLKKKILLIGAGGAARGIYVTLARMGAKNIDIANRTVSKAIELIETNQFPLHSKAFAIDEAEEMLAEYEIVINTTSVGMSPHIDHKPLSLKNMKAGTILSDIIYNPFETNWLKEGKRLGAITQNGIGMFVRQGALAFELWTNIKPDYDRMEQIVIQQLRGGK